MDFSWSYWTHTSYKACSIFFFSFLLSRILEKLSGPQTDNIGERHQIGFVCQCLILSDKFPCMVSLFVTVMWNNYVKKLRYVFRCGCWLRACLCLVLCQPYLFGTVQESEISIICFHLSKKHGQITNDHLWISIMFNIKGSSLLRKIQKTTRGKLHIGVFNTETNRG